MTSQKTTIIFGGDLYIKGAYAISPEIEELFQSADYAMLNLEAPIVSDRPEALPHPKAGPSLHNTPEICALLKKLKITHLGTANNHIYDFGKEGLVQTVAFAEKENLTVIGAGATEAAASTEAVIGNSVAIIAAGEEEFGVASETMPGIFSLYSPLLLERITELRKRHAVVILYAHGGGEMVPLPSPYLRKRYQECIDAGAQLVVAHHPHNIQGHEEYKDASIYYSLGNFIHSVHPSSLGLLLKIEVTDEGVAPTIIPITLKNNTLSLSSPSETADLTAYLAMSEQLLKHASSSQEFFSVLQEQAMDMYDSFYKSYFIGLFAPKLRLHIKGYKLLKKLFGIRDYGAEKAALGDELLLLHLLRNNSHKEFIELALKIKTGEIQDQRTAESKKEYSDLKKYILTAS